MDISNWDVSKVEDMYMYAIFYGSPLAKNPPHWFKE
jgi:hypothetical protein